MLNNLQSVSDYFVDHSKTTLYQVLYPTKQISDNELIKLIDLIKKNPDIEIFRIKGAFTNPDGQRLSINATKTHHEITPLIGGSKKDVLVIIGKNLIRDNVGELEKQLC